ncbi:transmembrane protein 225 [Loxodonta africana]|uniref:transmembrane protein 225 n=1 Tax=Loxodonta africana TaxID=9785 RepID=UPI0001952A25|nr:transmembrane protein 225 [Loxodonta africana]XP_049713340.1 transmembrane protein 225 [Elephas maximus indicus]
MVEISVRSIQTTNMILSSLALIILVIGTIAEKWIELKLEAKKITINHSPWMLCCITTWPEDDLEVVRIMMILTLSLSFLLNLVLGMEFTYLIPQTIYIHFISAFLSFLTGIILLSALLLYHHKLRQGQSVYYTSYKITWIPYTAYVIVTFFVTCGILSILNSLQFVNRFTCLNIINKSDRECKEIPQSGSSIKVISSTDASIKPRSIVRLHSVSVKGDVLDKSPPVQVRRVTWAL